MVREAGRDPASLEISLFGIGENLDRVKRFAEMGVARVVPMFPPEKADTVLPIHRSLDENHAAGQRMGWR
jgi:hypothetical protein